jgi:hypothetical protein
MPPLLEKSTKEYVIRKDKEERTLFRNNILSNTIGVGSPKL